MSKIFQSRLKNGLRIVLYNDSKAVIGHCALMIGAGTRHEEENQSGMAHFIEHMLFKGTKKRKSIEILNHLEVVGGELNAFTSKEETCIHASFLSQHLNRAIDLIADISLNSVFPVKEIEKEKEVIKDEIRMYNDTPSEQIYDDFEAQIFSHSTLGNPILGTSNTLSQFRQRDLIQFVKKNYHTQSMVLVVYGNYKLSEVEKLACKLFNYDSGSKDVKTFKPSVTEISKYKTTNVRIQKPISQSHFILGRRAYSLQHKNRSTMVLLNNILGGPGMNSRLNLAVREKFGYTYAIESGYHAYSDNGIFHLYLATEKKHLNKSIDLAGRELKKLRQKKLSSLELKNYKNQFIGQLALANENKANITISAAKSILHFDKPFVLSEVIKKIENVTQSDIYNCANEIFNTSSMSSLLFYTKKQAS